MLHLFKVAKPGAPMPLAPAPPVAQLDGDATEALAAKPARALLAEGYRWRLLAARIPS